jgi:hypothetical protein
MLRALPFLLFFLLACATGMEAQVFTKQSYSIDADRFNLGFLMIDFQGTTNARQVREYILLPQIGLTKRVEFFGWIPFLRVSEPDTEPVTSLGDMTLDLRFQIRQGWFRFPYFQEKADTRFYLNFYLGFNGPTGPKQFEYDGLFFPYANGLKDFRWGFLFGAFPGDFEIHLNFIYVYASYPGESFLPVTKDPWNMNTNPKSYFFNLHRIFLKFLWPGPSYGEWPFRDDYFLYNVDLTYWLIQKPVIFRYKVFMELNGLQNFNSVYCIRKKQLDFSAGFFVRFVRGFKGILGGSLPLVEGNYKGTRFFAGVNFTL